MDYRTKGLLAIAILSEMRDAGAIFDEEFRSAANAAYRLMATGAESEKVADRLATMIQRTIGGVVATTDEQWTPTFEYEGGVRYCGSACYGRNEEGQCRFGWSDGETCPSKDCPGMIRNQEVQVLLRRRF